MRERRISQPRPCSMYHSGGLILGVIPIEPDPFSFPLESQYVRCDAVEEPTVMADDNGATRKILQGLFEGAQGVHVKVIGGLVKQQDIAPFLQHTGKMHAVPLAARQSRDLFLLVSPREIEPRHIGAQLAPPLAS